MIAVDESRYDALRVDVAIGLGKMISAHQIDIFVISIDALEVEGDANAIGGR